MARKNGLSNAPFIGFSKSIRGVLKKIQGLGNVLGNTECIQDSPHQLIHSEPEINWPDKTYQTQKNLQVRSSAAEIESLLQLPESSFQGIVYKLNNPYHTFCPDDNQLLIDDVFESISDINSMPDNPLGDFNQQLLDAFANPKRYLEPFDVNLCYGFPNQLSGKDF